MASMTNRASAAVDLTRLSYHECEVAMPDGSACSSSGHVNLLQSLKKKRTDTTVINAECIVATSVCAVPPCESYEKALLYVF